MHRAPKYSWCCSEEWKYRLCPGTAQALCEAHSWFYWEAVIQRFLQMPSPSNIWRSERLGLWLWTAPALCEVSSWVLQESPMKDSRFEYELLFFVPGEWKIGFAPRTAQALCELSSRVLKESPIKASRLCYIYVTIYDVLWLWGVKDWVCLRTAQALYEAPSVQKWHRILHRAASF